MMKVCFVLGGFTSGGIGRVVSILANRLSQEDNIEVHIINLAPPKKDEIYNLEKNIKRKFIIKEYSSMKKVIIEVTCKLRKYIKSNNIDIVIACGNIFFLPVLLAAIGKCKTVCWEHSNVDNTKDNFGQSLWRNIASRFSDSIVTLTDFDKNRYIQKFKCRRVRRIYNPIDSALEITADNYDISNQKIISVGRICYQKQFEIIPKIAEKFINKYPNCSWDIYGDGEDLQKLKHIINEYGLQEKIFLKGQVKNLYELYNDYAVIVMTSRYEGFPMTLLEGASRGLPMISFDILTGPNEIIDSGINGYLVEDFNIEEMARKIEEVIIDDKLKERMSISSKAKTQQFNLDNIMAEWKILFKDLISLK